MPPKASRPKNNQKAELAEKVREIKQRQEKWFKQRDQQKARLSPTEGHKSTAPRHTMRQTHTIRKGTNSMPTSPLPEVSQSGFRSANDRLISDNYDAQPRERTTGRHSRDRSLSPEMFNTVADQIIHKVKREMHMDDTNDHDTACDTESKYDDGIQPSRGTQQRVASYHCQICTRVMIGPDCSPQLLIPCGHTLCAKCVGRHCPSCGTAIQTVAPNLTLQQLVTEYSHNCDAGRSKSASKKRASHSQQKTRDLNGEYETLTLRCEVLTAEGNNLNARIEQLERAAESKVQQAQQVHRQQRLIDEQIEQLRNEQSALEGEREMFIEESEGFQDKVREEEERLKMITSTIKSLRKDMDEIKHLANGTGTVH